MRKEDVKINLSQNKQSLTIEGLRMPTKDEELQLRKLVRDRLRAQRVPFDERDEIAVK
jgi:HSP20 family molecular chaperone IbpA